MVSKTDASDWTITDKRYGWKYGCDGFVNAAEASRRLGRSQAWMSLVLNGEDRKKSGGTGYPLRAGKPKIGPGSEWSVCVRSINEYLAQHEPVEV